MRERVFHVGLQIAELAAAVVTLAGELVGVHRLVTHEPRDAVGELDLAARAFANLLEMREQARREQVAAHHREIRGRLRGLRLFHDAIDAQQIAAFRPPVFTMPYLSV